MPGYFLRNGSEHFLVHNHHQTEDQQQVHREQGYMDVVGDQTEQGRHQAVADVGAGHLDTDERLRMFGTEMLRRGVDHAGIDGGTAQADEDQSCDGGGIAQRQKHGADARQDHSLTHPDELGIGKLHGQESVQCPSGGDADEEHACKKSGSIRRDPLVQSKIGAGPKRRGLLQGAVAEEGDHDLLRTGNGDHRLQRQRLCGGTVFRFGALLPQRQTQKENGGQQQLEKAHRAVAAAPVAAAEEDGTHDIGTDSGADAPHAVQPAHV